VAILFDADGVVQRPAQGSAERLAARLDVDGAGRLFDELFAAELPTFTGAIRLRDAIEPVLSRWGRAELINEVMQLWFQIEVDAVVIGTIARLRAAGVRVYLATNQGADRGAYMRRTLGYADLFEDQYYSCELGLAKPDPAYFTAILERLELPPEEVLFVDDNEANVEAARSIGLRAHLFPSHQTAALAAILEANGLVLPDPRPGD
jgi:putative hydrolase of the HAD superfamily